MTSRSRDRSILIIQRCELTTTGSIVDPTVDDSRRIGQLHGRHRSRNLDIESDLTSICIEDHDTREVLWRVSAIKISFRRDIEGIGEPCTIGRGEGRFFRVNVDTLQRTDVVFMRGVLHISGGEGPRGFSCRGVQTIDTGVSDNNRTTHSGKNLLHIHVTEGDLPVGISSRLLLAGSLLRYFLHTRITLIMR